MTLTLTWRGTSAECAGLSLNGQTVLAGTRVQIALEQHGAEVGLRPEFVDVFEVLDGPLRRVFGRRRLHLARLHLRDAHWFGSNDVASTEVFLVKPPPTTRGIARFECQAESQKTLSAWIDSASSDRGYQLTSAVPRALTTKSSVSIEPVTAELQLGTAGGSSTTTERYLVTAVDPHLVLRPLLPGAAADLQSYVEDYVSDVALRLGVSPRAAVREFLGVWGAHLTEGAAEAVSVQLSPSEATLAADGVQAVQLTATAIRSSKEALLLAIRVEDVATGHSSVSELIRVQRGEMDSSSSQVESRLATPSKGRATQPRP